MEKKSKKYLKYFLIIFIMLTFVSSSFMFISVGTERKVEVYILPGGAFSYSTSVAIHSNTTLKDLLDGLQINYTMENSTIKCFWDFCSTNNSTWHLYIGEDVSSLEKVELNLSMNLWNTRIVAFILEK